MDLETQPLSPPLDAHRHRERAARAAKMVAGLSPRQREVLDGMVDGLMNKQIAMFLMINEKTVKMHRALLLDRLGVSNSAQAIRIGVEASFASEAAPASH